MTRQPPASGLVLHKYDHTAYRVFDRVTGRQLGYVVAWWERWTAETMTRIILAEGRTRSDALHAAWPEKHPTRPTQPPDPVGGQSGEGDRPNSPQNDAQTGAA